LFFCTQTVITMKNTHIVLGVVLMICGSIIACRETDPTPTTPDKLTLAKALINALDDTLKGKDIGYAAIVFENGKQVAQSAGGYQARSIESGGAKDFTINTKMHIASMSKTLTTIAFLKLAQQKGIKTSDLIMKYLPAAWSKGTGIDKITFADLLTHRSGIIGFGSNCLNGSYSENIYGGLQQLIQKGVTTRGTYCYQNTNFGMFRILIPSILGYNFSSTDATNDSETQRIFLEYLQKEVFDVAQVPNVQNSNPTNSTTYTYDYPFSNVKGWNTGTFNREMGAYGLYLSVTEAAQIYATALTTASTAILGKAYQDTLLSKKFGCFTGQSSGGETFYYHDGWWYLNEGSGKGKGLRTVWMMFPNNMVCVLFVNALKYRSANNSLEFPFNNYNIVGFVGSSYLRAKLAAPARLSTTNTDITLEHPENH
jgi:Beta-lactamase